mgnify:CR=1 FL=1
MTYAHFHSIKDTEDKWYKSFLEIYTISFPVYEQRNPKQQKEAFSDSRYHLIAKIEEEKFISFIAYWEFENYIYIEHLAVNPELRGQNKGSELLKDFADIMSKTIILEIDPLTDEISRKRLVFYEKLGYKTNPYKHFHPPYDKSYTPHQLVVLSLNRQVDQKEYEQFHSDLSHIVMKD